MKLTASGNILKNNGKGTQNWGDSVTLTAFDLNGKVGQVAYDTEFRDSGFGVTGGRWQQIDYQGGRSESLEINFGGSVKDVVLTLGQMKEGERSYQGKKYDETGKWTAYDTSGKQIATGLLGPDRSSLGSGVKISGSYGQYPIKLNTSSAIGKIVIEATGFGHGKAPSRSRKGVEDSSDFNLVGLNYNRVSYGKNAPSTPVEKPATPTPPPIVEPVKPPVAEPVSPPVKEPVKPPVAEPNNNNGDGIELDASRDILDGSKNKQVWNQDVSIKGLTFDGQAGTLFYSRNGFGIKEGGSKFQIDYDPQTNRSEQLVIDFNKQVSQAQLEVGLMETKEWNNLNETGKWQAYNAAGRQVGSGVLDPAKGTSVGGGNYTFKINNLSESFSQIKISATDYGNGTNSQSTGDSSDFNLRGLTYTLDSSGNSSNPSNSGKSNSIPVAKNDGGFKTLENNALTISTSELLKNDFDADGDALDIKWVGNAKNGTVSLNNNKITFAPNANYAGQAKFTYTIADTLGNKARALVSIDVAEANIGQSANNNSSNNNSSIQLKASKNLVNGKEWGEGVVISGLTVDGKATAVNYARGGFAIDGSRYGYQIDYDPVSGKSEKIVIDFDRAISKAKLDIGFMSTNEWKGLNETGKWTAYDDGGRQIESGTLDPALGMELGNGDYSFEIAQLPEAFSQLTVEATAYGNGIGGDRTSNNSDFNLRGLAYTEA